MAFENWQAVSPLVIPEIMQLFKNTQKAIPGRNTLKGMDQIVAQGINSPLLSAVLEPAMANLMRGFDDQRTALADQYRAAGASRSSQYLNRGIPALEGELANAQGNLISSLTSQTLSPILQGLLQSQQQQFLPAEAMTRLLGAVKPDVHFGNGGGSSGGGSSYLGGSPSMMNNPFWSTTGPQPGAPGGLHGGMPTSYIDPNFSGAYQPSAAEQQAYYNPNGFDWNAYEASFMGLDNSPGQPIAYNPATGFYETPNLPALVDRPMPEQDWSSGYDFWDMGGF